MIRVLQIFGSLDIGGVEAFLVNYYRNIDRTKIQFDFLIYENYREHYNDDVLLLGARIFKRPRLKHNPFRNLNVLRKVLKDNPDIKIIHTHGCLPFVLLDLYVASLCGVKIRFVHSHNKSHGVRLLRPFYQKLAMLITTKHLACSTEAGMSLFGKSIFTKDKLSLIKNAINIEQYRYSTERRMKIRDKMDLGDKFIVFHVGRFEKVKNQEFLLKAFACAVNKQLNIVLLIAGDGSEHKHLLEVALELGICDYVKFLGKRDDVADLLQAADIFVLPSISEGLGIAAIEAQAAGLPCLLSNGVPFECKITDNVEFLPIDKGVDIWAERMITYRDFNRIDPSNDVYKAGYDIKSAVKELEKFYLP
ncbi:MAG: glycosyltransferase family 1 protein [Oscillospiraceae bacterium]|jgi:glycosyltransferase involved in cell wall biosynthesis|nr:glycosyltransferase family 1 protein [Oscillospiraceae bacterium]